MLERGGGGVRILISPTDLRRGSRKLKDVGTAWGLVARRIRSAPRPEMPPGIAGRVETGLAQAAESLQSRVDPLTDGAVELDRRALWTEIADQLIAGVPLEGSLLSKFMDALGDGTLVRYAEPWQAELAGQVVGDMYRSTYRDPDQLIALARILQKNGGYGEASGAFMAGFVEHFGAENVVDIPRVIQAMDWTPSSMIAGSSDDPYVDWELGNKLFNEGYQLDVDPVELLGAFSMALALATTSGRLSSDVEREIAYDEDSWAVAQLVHEGTFGATFLRDVLHSGVIAEIGRHAASFGGPGIGYMAIGGGDGEGPEISTDQRLLIMNALLRNPEAAALALSSPVPEQFQISSYLEGKDDPIEILYDVARWDDDGELFAKVYTAGVNYASDTGDAYTAHHLTQSLIDRTLHSDHGLAPLTFALGDDIAAHHISDLHLAAAANNPGDPDAGGLAGRVIWDESLGELRLDLGTNEMEDLFRALSDEPEAYDTVLRSAAHWQADTILAGTTVDADSERADLSWANRIGAFDAVLMNASDLERIEDFDAGNERHRIFFSFVTNVAGLIPHPAAGVAVGTGISIIEGASGPDLQELVRANDDGRQLLLNSMHAQIVAGYYENGLIVHDGPPSSLVRDGHLAAYQRLSPSEVADFNGWMGNSDEISDVAGEAWDRADRAFYVVDTDQQ